MKPSSPSANKSGNDSGNDSGKKAFTGRKAFLFLGLFFAIILLVNLAFMALALRSFPGTVPSDRLYVKDWHRLPPVEDSTD